LELWRVGPRARNPRIVQGQVRDGTESSFERDSADHDVVSQHMHRLYEKYNRELNQLVEGNTVRSFRASQGECGCGRPIDVYDEH
jgi:hypothetical protein